MSQSALDVLGQDFVFPNKIEDVPAKLSDFAGLQIHNVYTKEEQGDHFLPFKNPVKFTEDLSTFLAR